MIKGAKLLNTFHKDNKDEANLSDNLTLKSFVTAEVSLKLSSHKVQDPQRVHHSHDSQTGLTCRDETRLCVCVPQADAGVD